MQMPIINDIPTFNLKVVLRETGIKPDTIRAWERRYGLPEPERTAGKHRLYSQRDIEMIKWLMARQDEGLSISRAVDLWRSLEAESRDPLSDSVYQIASASPQPMVEFSVGAALDEIRQSWIDTCLVFDEAQAEAILSHAFALYPAEVVCTEVLQKGISQIGQSWFQGTTSVQQEHFATALATRKLNTLISASPSPHHQQKIIVACPPKEDHTFSALLITLMMRQRGWPVVYLGANVPIAELQKTITNVQASLLVLPAQQLHTAATLSELASSLYHKIPIAYGGRIFNLLPDIRSRIPGYFIGSNLSHIGPTLEHLITQTSPNPLIQPASAEYQTTLMRFRDQKAAIEAHIWDKLGSNGIARQHLVIANEHLTQDIEAALVLGDIYLLGNEIKWIEELLANYGLPQIGLIHFLHAYHNAVLQILGQHNQIIATWFEQALSTVN
ncbi:MAG TPA: hypothetical protein DEH25_00230 [Chloroflexi bacterium]|nr:hypothetical protein [Chloroflexota bacterium]